MEDWLPIEHILEFSVALAIKIDSYIETLQSAHNPDGYNQQAIKGSTKAD